MVQASRAARETIRTATTTTGGLLKKESRRHRRSFFDVDGDGWEYDKTTNSYYLHYFSQKQPDLNWENPKLRSEVFSMMRFWFDKGVDGFRMDVIPFISKDTTYPEMPAQYNGDWGRFYANGPHVHEYLREMNEAVLSKYDVMSVAEGAGVTTADALQYVDANRRELDMLYHFEGVVSGLPARQSESAGPEGLQPGRSSRTFTASGTESLRIRAGERSISATTTSRA